MSSLSGAEVQGSSEAVTFGPIAATTGPFTLGGGLYQLSAVATWSSGSILLEQLGPDGAAWLSVSSTITTNSGQTLYLPRAQYRIAVDTATDAFVSILRVPGA